MTRFSSAGLLVLAVLIPSGCGNSRQLQIVTLSPASADAKNFPSGQVPFAATGTFNKPPSPAPVTSNEIVWCIGSANGAREPAGTPYPTVDQNGVAQCGPTFVGSTTVLAGTASAGESDAPVLKIFGSAQLTCP